MIMIKTFKQFINENNLNNASEEEQLAAVQRDAYDILRIKNPSEKVQLAAVKNDGLTITWIINPSLEVQKLVIQKGYIDSIKILSKDAQEWFIKQAPSNILKIHKDKLDPELAVKYNHLIKMGSAGILS